MTKTTEPHYRHVGDFYAKELEYLNGFSIPLEIDFTFEGKMHQYLDLLFLNEGHVAVAAFIAQTKSQLGDLSDHMNMHDSLEIYSSIYASRENQFTDDEKSLSETLLTKQHSTENRVLALLLHAQKYITAGKFAYAQSILEDGAAVFYDLENGQNEYCELLTTTAIETASTGRSEAILSKILSSNRTMESQELTAEIDWYMARIYFNCGRIQDSLIKVEQTLPESISHGLRNRYIILRAQIHSFVNGIDFTDSLRDQDPLYVEDKVTGSLWERFEVICHLIQNDDLSNAQEAIADAKNMFGEDGSHFETYRQLLYIGSATELSIGTVSTARSYIKSAFRMVRTETVYFRPTHIQLLFQYFTLMPTEKLSNMLPYLRQLRRQLQIQSRDKHYSFALTKSILIESDLSAKLNRSDEGTALLESNISGLGSSQHETGALLQMMALLVRIHIQAGNVYSAKQVIDSSRLISAKNSLSMRFQGVQRELVYLEILLCEALPPAERLNALDAVLAPSLDAQAFATHSIIEMICLKADILCELSEYEQAKSLIADAQELLVEKQGVSERLHYQLEYARGNILFATRSFEDAGTFFQTLVASNPEYFSNVDEQTISIRLKAATSLMGMGQYRTAMNDIKNLRADISRSDSAFYKVNLEATIEYAKCLEHLDGYAGAAFNYSNALKMVQSDSAISPIRLFEIMQSIAVNYELAGQIDDAAVGYAEALRFAGELGSVEIVTLEALENRLACCTG